MMARWLKFNAAGMLGVGVQLVTLHWLIRYAALNYLAATALAVETALLHNFLWHEKYTWNARTRSARSTSLRRLLHFNLSNGAVSLVGNVLLMRLLVEYFGLAVIAANLCAIAACSTLNFVIAEFFVFAKPDDAGLFV